MKKENKNLFIAGLILGLGLLGAIDGIVFHQLLQWHHMVLSDNIQLEIFTDGLFTALFSAKLLWGGVKIFQDARKNQLGSSWRIFLGVDTTEFRFAPEKVGSADPSYNEGHAHLYVNGKKINRLYGHFYNLDTLKKGENESIVTLNSNNHGALAYRGKPISSKVVVNNGK